MSPKHLICQSSQHWIFLADQNESFRKIWITGTYNSYRKTAKNRPQNETGFNI